jgi:hypothetical protein
VYEAITVFYAAVLARPLRAELFLIHAAASRTGAGRAAARDGAERFAELLQRGRAEAEERRGRTLPISAEEYFSRAIVALAARRVRGAEIVTLPAETRRMAALIIGFYLGLGRASKSSMLRSAA